MSGFSFEGSGLMVEAAIPEKKHLSIWPLRVGKEWEVGVENVVLAVELQPHLKRPGPDGRSVCLEVGCRNNTKKQEKSFLKS